MSLSQNYPTTRPTLTLDFAKAKRVDPRVTFTRATTATYFDASGTLRSAAANAPRIDFDPATLLCRGLLIEEQRANLLLQSENFTTTWSALNLTPTANTATSPAGTLTADTLTPAASSAAHLISQSATVTASIAYSASVFIKTDGAPFVQVAYDNGASVGCFMNVNLSTGAVTRGPELASGATNATGNVTNVGNGFYRISVGAKHTGTTGRILISPLPTGESAAGLNPTTTTAATDKIIVWGAQLEEGAFPTSYIPTTTTSLTRSADVASVTTLSPWYNASEGTLYSESQQAQDKTAGFPVPVSISDAASGVNCIEHIWNNSTSTLSGNVFSSGSPQAAIGVSGLTRTAAQKIALAYKLNDFAACIGGGSVGTDNTGTIPIVDRLIIGARPGSSLILNGHIQRITYYNTRLPNAQLQALTAP
jgi:hypothetical protein